MAIETNFDKPLINLLCLIYEVELFTEWAPFCSSSENVLYKINILFKIIFNINYIFYVLYKNIYNYEKY